MSNLPEKLVKIIIPGDTEIDIDKTYVIIEESEYVELKEKKGDT